MPYFRSFSPSNIWIFLGVVVIASVLPNDLRTELVSYVLSFSEQNCIPVVGGSQIEREILIALVFFPVEKEDVAKVAAKEALVRSDGNRRASNFTDFYFQGTRKRPIRKSCNLQGSHRKTATRQGLLRRRLMWGIVLVQKYDIILDKAPRNMLFSLGLNAVDVKFLARSL